VNELTPETLWELANNLYAGMGQVVTPNTDKIRAHADAWQAELEAAKAREDALNNIMHRAALVVARSSPLMDRTLIARTKAARWALKELADALAASEPPGEEGT